MNTLKTFMQTCSVFIPIGASPVSVAFASVSLAKQIFSNFDTHTALLIGAGETIELVSLHLKEVGIKQVIIANRTFEKAHKLATEVGGYAIELDEIPNIRMTSIYTTIHSVVVACKKKENNCKTVLAIFTLTNIICSSITFEYVP